MKFLKVYEMFCKNFYIFCSQLLTNQNLCGKMHFAVEKLNICGSGSVVERHLAKVNVASSNLVFRSRKNDKF